MATTTADPPALTLAAAAARLGRTLWEFEKLLRKRDDLAALVFTSGQRRMLLAADLPKLSAGFEQLSAKAAAH